MGIIFASGFLYLYLLYVQKPLSTSLGDEKDKKGMQGRVKLPCTGYMRLLASRCCASVHGYSRGDSILLFVLWDPGSLCKCKYASATLLYRIAFSLVPVDHH